MTQLHFSNKKRLCKRLCNLRPSPADSRDYSFEGMALRSTGLDFKSLVAEDPGIVTPPKKLDLRPYMNPVRDQGSRGTCAAFSAAAAKEYQEHVDNSAFKEYISPDSIYLQRQNVDSEGMYGRDVMRILLHGGACRETLLPYHGEEQEAPSGIPDTAKLEMPNYCIRKYAQIHTILGAKNALCQYGPLLICLPYYDNDLPEFWRSPGLDAETDGGHAVTVVGYTKEGFILRNSWGTTWNGDGHVIYPYDEFGVHWEIWSMVDEETKYLPPHLDPNNGDYVAPPPGAKWVRKLLCCQ